MKGNEAMVVFFLHPVDQLKDGQVSRVQPLRRSFVVLLLGLLLGLGVLVYVLLQFGVETRSQQEPVLFDATTKSPVTERTGETERSTEVTINQIRSNDSTTETMLPTKIILPGMIECFIT